MLGAQSMQSGVHSTKCSTSGRMAQSQAPVAMRQRWRCASASGQNISTADTTAVTCSIRAMIKQTGIAEAVKAALADGHKLLEVEFPASGLDAVQGDGEGMAEMNLSMSFLRQFVIAFREKASKLRVFWPDNVELSVALSGQAMDPSAGRSALDPVFENTAFQMGYLTKQNAIWTTFGVNFGTQFNPCSQIQATDELLIVAYPSFNPREEMGAVHRLYTEVCQARGLPIVTWNAELDRLRGGYYPGFAFRELAKLTREFLPKFETAYYIHNFKGTRPGILFRAYPGPWCVFRRSGDRGASLRLIWSSPNMPTLKQVALEILPGAQ